MEGLSKFKLNNISDFYELLEKGNKNRNIATTNVNATSSRSHAAIILTISNIQETVNRSAGDAQQKGIVRESTLFLVDLAGSER